MYKIPALLAVGWRAFGGSPNDAPEHWMMEVKPLGIRGLFQESEELGFEGVPYDFARTVNKSRRRLETCGCWVITDPEWLDYLQNRQQWAELNAVVKVAVQRETVVGTSVQSRY